MNTFSSILNFPKKIFSEPESLSDTEPHELASPLISPSNYKVSIAIDLGQSGIGIAYAYNNRVYPHTHWALSKTDPNSIKSKTLLLLNQSGKKLAFGKDAQTKYQTTDLSKSKKWMLFENFKLHLYDTDTDIPNIFEQTTQNHTNEHKINELKTDLTAVNGLKYSSESVFVQTFKHIKQECKRYLKTTKLRVTDTEIEYILTVPSIWSECAKFTLKQWAFKAQLFTNMQQCRIVYEPDAASIFIQHELYNRFIAKVNEHKTNNTGAIQPLPNTPNIFTNNLQRLLESKNSEMEEIDALPKFEKEMQYILIDGGGGTVDFACHEIITEFGQGMGVKELLPSSGGAWGSHNIDTQYESLLMNVFSKEWIDEFRNERPNVWSVVMDEFRTAKKKFFVNAKLAHYFVGLPQPFLHYLQGRLDSNTSDTKTQTLEQFVNKIRIDFKSKKNKAKARQSKAMIRLQNNGLLMTVELWKSMFNSVINPVIRHCEQLLDSDHLCNVQYLCLVGGLCSSKYFQKRIEKAFGMESMHRLKIIVPSKPLLAIVCGAAYLSITKNYIRSRILNASYGIEIDKTLESAKSSNVADHHIEAYKYYDSATKQYFVKKCFCIYANKYQTIETGQIIEKTYNRTPPNAKKIKIKIFYSVISNPTVTTSAIQNLADLILTFEDKNVRQITVEFHFYDTEIKVYSYPKGQKEKRHQIQLNYAMTDY